MPADVLAAAPLERGEKVLAGAVDRSGAWLLGTRDALIVAVGTAPVPGPVAVRIPWQDIERADWDKDAERLTVQEVGEFGQARPAYSFNIDDPGVVLELIRERVTASVVLQRRVALEGKRGLFVIARRAPRGDGEITWAYEFDPGVEPGDPGVMAAAEQGMRAAQEELGI